ncbi:MAG TPA: YaiO family outer membrane beta-barrel protein [Oscillatoriaceae cyanobacterium]
MLQPRLQAVCVGLALAFGMAAPAWALPQTVWRAIDESRYSDAQSQLQAWLKAHPYDTEAHCTLAHVLYLQGQSSAALAEYGHVLVLAPDDPDGLLGKAQVLLALHQAAEAIPPLERALEIDAGNEAVWRTLAEAYDASGQPRMAMKTKLAAARRFPKSNWSPPEDGPTGDTLMVLARGETLTNGEAPWNAETLEYQHLLGPRAGLVASLGLTNRFAVEDATFGLGAAGQVTDRLALGLQGIYSPTHEVVPLWRLDATGRCALGAGWKIGLEGERTQYATSTGMRGALSLEKLLGSFRVSYAPALIQLGDVNAGLGQRAEIAYAYGQDDLIALSGELGPAYAFAGPQQLIAVSERGLTLSGHHWVNRAWSATYALSWNQEGNLYTRDGVTLGLTRRF